MVNFQGDNIDIIDIEGNMINLQKLKPGRASSFSLARKSRKKQTLLQAIEIGVSWQNSINQASTMYPSKNLICLKTLMSCRTERKCCLISTSYLAGLIDIFILLHI